jgi:hypothetical protein
LKVPARTVRSKKEFFQMSMYRYCGAKTDVGELTLSKFGQLIEFPDDVAKLVILGGGAIVPVDHPTWKAFTEQELSIYSNPAAHGEANTQFLAKKRAVQAEAIALRARVEAGEVFAPAPKPAAAPVVPAAAPVPAAEPGVNDDDSK